MDSEEKIPIIGPDGKPLDFSAKGKSKNTSPGADGESEIARHFRELGDKLGEKLDTLTSKSRPQLTDQELEDKIRELLAEEEAETRPHEGDVLHAEEGPNGEKEYTTVRQEVYRIKDGDKRAEMRRLVEARLRLRGFFVDGEFPKALADGAGTVLNIKTKPTEKDFQVLVDDRTMPGVVRGLQLFEECANQMRNGDLARKGAKSELQYNYAKPGYWEGDPQEGIRGVREIVREELGAYLRHNFGDKWVRYADDHERIAYELFNIWLRKAQFGRHCVDPSEPGGKIVSDGFLVAAKKTPGLSQALVEKLGDTRYARTGATHYLVSHTRAFPLYESEPTAKALGFKDANERILYRDVNIAQEDQPPGTLTKEALDQILSRKMEGPLEHAQFDGINYGLFPYEGFLKGLASADSYRSKAMAVLREGDVETRIQAAKGIDDAAVGHFLPAEKEPAKRFWLRMAHGAFRSKAEDMKGGKGAVVDLSKFVNGGAFAGDLYPTYLACMKSIEGKPLYSTTTGAAFSESPLSLEHGAVEVVNLLGGDVYCETQPGEDILEGRRGWWTRSREVAREAVAGLVRRLARREDNRGELVARGRDLVEAFFNKLDNGEWRATEGSQFISFEDVLAYAGVCLDGGRLRLARPYINVEQYPDLAIFNEVFADGTTIVRDRHGRCHHLDEHKKGLIERVLASRLGDPDHRERGCVKIKGIPDIHEHILGKAAELYVGWKYVYEDQIVEALKELNKLVEHIVPQLRELDDDRPEQWKLENLTRQSLDLVDLRRKIAARIAPRDRFGSDEAYNEAIYREYLRLSDEEKLEDRPKFEGVFSTDQEYREALRKARELHEERQREQQKCLASETVDPILHILRSHWRDWGKDAAHLKAIRLYLEGGLLLREFLAENAPGMVENFATGEKTAAAQQLTPEDMAEFLEGLAAHPFRAANGMEQPMFKNKEELNLLKRLFYCDRKNVAYHQVMRWLWGIKNVKLKDGRPVATKAGSLLEAFRRVPVIGSLVGVVQATMPHSALETVTKVGFGLKIGVPIAQAFVGGPDAWLIGGAAWAVGFTAGWLAGTDFSYGAKGPHLGDWWLPAWPRDFLRSNLARRTKVMGVRLGAWDNPDDPSETRTNFTKNKVDPYL